MLSPYTVHDVPLSVSEVDVSKQHDPMSTNRTRAHWVKKNEKGGHTLFFILYIHCSKK